MFGECETAPARVFGCDREFGGGAGIEHVAVGAMGLGVLENESHGGHARSRERVLYLPAPCARSEATDGEAREPK
jgi:hypothetical protein